MSCKVLRCSVSHEFSLYTICNEMLYVIKMLQEAPQATQVFILVRLPHYVQKHQINTVPHHIEGHTHTSTHYNKHPNALGL